MSSRPSCLDILQSGSDCDWRGPAGRNSPQAPENLRAVKAGIKYLMPLWGVNYREEGRMIVVEALYGVSLIYISLRQIIERYHQSVIIFVKVVGFAVILVFVSRIIMNLLVLQALSALYSQFKIVPCPFVSHFWTDYTPILTPSLLYLFHRPVLFAQGDSITSDRGSDVYCKRIWLKVDYFTVTCVALVDERNHCMVLRSCASVVVFACGPCTGIFSGPLYSFGDTGCLVLSLLAYSWLKKLEIQQHSHVLVVMTATGLCCWRTGLDPYCCCWGFSC